MTQSKENARVEQQYTQWVYPAPIEDLDAFLKGSRLIADPTELFHLYFPARPYAPLDILVAGCGTRQAAVVAYTNPDHRVTGIDISPVSLEHTRSLKAKYRLNNLRVENLSLFDVEKLGTTYDLIFSTGVLHHLPDPVAGATALKSVLATDGVIHLMLYGRTRRVGIYLLQEAFRAMGLAQTQQDVDLIKKMLPFLPPKHAVHAYGLNGPDFQYDAGMVDTLLHPQDTPFSVNEIYDFGPASGLAFRGWLDNGLYCPEHYFKSNFPGLEKLQRLSFREKAIFVDNFFQATGTHRFNLCHPDTDPATYAVSFATDDWLGYIPILRKPVSVVSKADWDAGRPPLLKRGGYTLRPGKSWSLLLETINGERTIDACAQKAFAHIDNLEQPPVELARSFFKAMWNRGHLFFRFSR